MTIEYVVAFNVALLAAIVSPGPAFLVAVKTTLSQGRTAGIAVGCGLGLVAALWTGAALLGVEVIFELFPWAYTTAKVLGALYLLYIAIGMWRGARDPAQADAYPTSHLFRRGILINILNPKSVLFAAAVLVVIFPPSLSFAESLIVVLNHFLTEILFYSALAFIMSTPTVSNAYLRVKLYIDRTCAVIIGGLGLKLLSQR